MAEGGLFPWKMQKVWSKPTASFKNLSEPLRPEPPAGMTWQQQGREWKLVAENNNKTNNSTPESVRKETVHTVVDTLPPTVPREHHAHEGEAEWELLSDKFSSSSHPSEQAIFVSKAGSVRSLATLENDGSTSSHHTTLSVPFKIARTHSSSTIDSTDNALGPAGKGVLGVDYVEHVVLPTDTMQGICIAYKINSTRLRQANGFSGNSLLLAPKKLVIPISKKALRSGYIRMQDTDAKEYKLHAFLAEFPDCSLTEAKAYLELADWILPDAVQSAKEDQEWEDEAMDASVLKAGEIRLQVNKMGLTATGAGIRHVVSKDDDDDDDKDESDATGPQKQPQVIACHAVPAIATKTVKGADVYKAAPQHDAFGVEMQSLPGREASSVTTPLLAEEHSQQQQSTSS